MDTLHREAAGQGVVWVSVWPAGVGAARSDSYLRSLRPGLPPQVTHSGTERTADLVESQTAKRSLITVQGPVGQDGRHSLWMRVRIEQPRTFHVRGPGSDNRKANAWSTYPIQFDGQRSYSRVNDMVGELTNALGETIGNASLCPVAAAGARQAELALSSSARGKTT
jgi:hypothetical protein